MATLLLLRHGKSDQGAGTTDLDRPLTDRGRWAASVVGAYLNDIGFVPDVAMTSPAVRARTTLDLAVQTGSWSTEVRVAEELYMQGHEPVLELVRAEEADTELLMLVGHEPTWSTIVELLTGATVELPTATLAAIELERGWASAERGAGALSLLVPGRRLPGYR